MSKFILHIGYGKTGTTALQGWLFRNREFLADRGVLDCGVVLNNPALGDPLCDSVPSLVKDIRVDASAVARKIADRLLSTSAEHDVIVWSAEFMLQQHHFVSALVEKLAASHEVEIVIYLRNHVDWLISAYAQWAIKHPISSRGAVKVVPFENFVAQRVHDLDYLTALDRWGNMPGAVLNARSYDRCDDIIADFASVIGIDAAELGKDSAVNENMGPSQLSLLKIMQENGAKDIPYRTFEGMLNRAGANRRDVKPVDPTPIPVSDERLQQLHDGFTRQRSRLRHEFELELSGTAKTNRYGARPGVDETNTDLISLLGMICFNLHERVAELESELEALKAKPAERERTGFSLLRSTRIGAD